MGFYFVLRDLGLKVLFYYNENYLQLKKVLLKEK